MKQYVANIDEQKLAVIMDIKERFEDGKISLEEAQDELLDKVKQVTASEIAVIEQEIKVLDDEDCLKKDIQEMVAIFDKVRQPVAFDLAKDHPVKSYLLENDAIRQTVQQLSDLMQKQFDKAAWQAAYDKLMAYKIHFSRKQNQLYSELERRGFDRPSKIMWTLDDYIRDAINAGHDLLKSGEVEKLIGHQKTLNADLLDLIGKEEEILYPTSLDMLTEDEFRQMRLGDDEIGYANIEKPTEFLPQKDNSFTDELTALLQKHGYGKTDETLKVAEGLLTLEQINLIYKHLPVDFSYVDEDNKVRFYSDTEHRVFPRSRSAIGRDVKNCHPQRSVHIVEEIIEAFKAGKQDRAEFWINKEGVFIYILYVAVRDAKGNYRGVLEMMQDTSHIRSLEGSQTLLNWSNENSETDKNEDLAAQVEGGNMVVTKDTRLKDIIEHDPSIKEKLMAYNSNFEMLKSPLAKVIVPVATVEMMSERSGVELETLIAKLNEWLN